MFSKFVKFIVSGGLYRAPVPITVDWRGRADLSHQISHWTVWRVAPLGEKPTSVVTDLYPHMPILRPHAARYSTNGASLPWQLSRRISTLMFTVSGRGPRAHRFVRFWASGGAKFTKMGDSLPWTPMNRRAKFDAASFIIAGEIRNPTNKQNYR